MLGAGSMICWRQQIICAYPFRKKFTYSFNLTCSQEHAIVKGAAYLLAALLCMINSFIIYTYNYISWVNLHLLLAKHLRNSGNLLLLLAFKSCRILKKPTKPNTFWRNAFFAFRKHQQLPHKQQNCSSLSLYFRANFLQSFPKEFLEKCLYKLSRQLAALFFFLSSCSYNLK